ncbi:hypothetical protein [Shewanella algae]|uniref:hypothetical protein n=1 Tax=Shewanella algae TaxID=38313 RepID=UPI001AAD4BFD|nr:hypothetical protein [Shewanella algae]MBO2700808.1 hypothetical protein [Shewanella algae]
MIQNDSNGGDNIFFFDDSAKEQHMTTRELTKKTLSSEDMHIEVSHMFNAEEKFAELKRYVIGTGIGIAGLILAGFGLVISVQQIYGTGQERVADSHYETLVTRLTSAEEYFKATGERQDLFKESVNNSVKSIVGDVKDNKQVIATLSDDVKDNKQMMSTILEQQQRTNATLDKLVAEKK